MKVAIVHDWLVNYGGAERVVEQMLALYPDADIFTLVYNEKKMGKYFAKEKVHTSFLQKFPFATKLYTKFLTFMPKAFESFDLTGYDLVIASSSSCAKGVITSPDTPYLAYIHTPMRYAWDLYYDYFRRAGRLTRFFMKRQMPAIRVWDFISSQRIDTLVANSSYIASRIKKFWGRDSLVIHPPVDTDRLEMSNLPAEDFYLVFSRFVPYKRIDLAISACGQLKRHLVVLGGGSQEKELKKLASYFKDAKIEFKGRLSDKEVASYLQRCRALIFCAEEDFGIIPVEAQACGRPVIAYGKGGALETVVEGKTGIFFAEQTSPSLMAAIETFERMEKEGAFLPNKIRENAEKFSSQRFRAELQQAVDQTIQKI